MFMENLHFGFYLNAFLYLFYFINSCLRISGQFIFKNETYLVICTFKIVFLAISIYIFYENQDAGLRN